MNWRRDRVRRVVAVLSLIGVVVGSPLVAAANDYVLGQRAWSELRYRDAYTHLWRYRQEPYGRIAQVDYMLGTSGCRLEDLRNWGRDVLRWILNRYELPETSRQLVQYELSQCNALQPPPISAGSLAVVQNLIGASSGASGKTFYWLGRNEQFNSYPAYRLREIRKDELTGRLVPLGQRERIVQETLARAPGFRVAAFDRFVLATRSGHSTQTLDRMALYLERYLQFLERDYGVTLPPVFLTVYMVPTSDDVGKLADRLHGLKVSRATFGYSYRDDMSVVAAIPDGFLIGTIMHEFFHLAVRSNFGDIPQWLDEGLASLYEVAKFQGDTVLGLPNWRGRVLVELKHRRPRLKQLITSDWFAFEQFEYGHQLRELQSEGHGDKDTPSAEQMAATLATARYFTLYLQEKGQLKPIFDALQKLVPGEGSASPSMDAVALVESRLGRSIDQIDGDFLNWFDAGWRDSQKSQKKSAKPGAKKK